MYFNASDSMLIQSFETLMLLRLICSEVLFCFYFFYVFLFYWWQRGRRVDTILIYLFLFSDTQTFVFNILISNSETCMGTLNKFTIYKVNQVFQELRLFQKALTNLIWVNQACISSNKSSSDTRLITRLSDSQSQVNSEYFYNQASVLWEVISFMLIEIFYTLRLF